MPPPATSFSKVKGLVYTVQVGSFPKKKDFKKLGKIKQLFTALGEDSAIKYNSGIYSNINDAKTAREIIVANTPVKDAFVTAYYNGNRISLSKANELLGKTGKMELTQTTKTSSNNNINIEPEQWKAVKENNVSPGTDKNGSKSEDETADTGFGAASKTRVIYSVQIASYTKELPVDSANIILRYSNEGIVAQKEKHGVTTYFVGNYSDIEAANLLKQKLYNDGFHQCHTVAYYHGKRISLQEAQGIPNK